MEPATERKIFFLFHFHFVQATKSQNTEFCDNFFRFHSEMNAHKEVEVPKENVHLAMESVVFVS